MFSLLGVNSKPRIPPQPCGIGQLPTIDARVTSSPKRLLRDGKPLLDPDRRARAQTLLREATELRAASDEIRWCSREPNARTAQARQRVAALLRQGRE